ncbi:hypothetical protein [Sorangium sp. So ce362]|uniref:hypothetical protein n=1 Tax=Sorangium sp. So ce362 TaxID=3133303 RepID=UPI003F62052D
MSGRYAVIRGEELRELRGPEPPTGRDLLLRLAVGAPMDCSAWEVILRWADVIDWSPRLVWHAAEAFATYARGLRLEETAQLFDRAALCAVVELEWPKVRRADLRSGAPR